MKLPINIPKVAHDGTCAVFRIPVRLKFHLAKIERSLV